MRRFFSAILLILAAVPCPAAVPSVKLFGHIYDADNGAPIADARIALNTTAYIVHSDDFGIFSFENIPPGQYTLTVLALGYKDYTDDEVDIVVDITRRLEIRLYKKNFQIEGIMVAGRRVSFSGDRVAIIEREEINTSRATNLSELLEMVDGVHVQKTGTAAGPARVKIRGGSSEHVLVLVDGQKINPSGSGVADLNSIPLEMVERLEIHKGGASAEFGPDALAGVINIITRPRRVMPRFSIEGEKKWGPWKTEIKSLMVANPYRWQKLSSRFAYNSKKTNGDFDFNYVQPDTVISGTRINSDLETSNYFSTGIYQPSAGLKLSYSGQLYKSESGLPGRPANQNVTARLTDHRKLFTLGLNYDGSSENSLQLQFGFSRFTQHFEDRDSVRVTLDSRFVNDIFNLSYRHSLRFWVGNFIRFGAELRRDILYHDDFVNAMYSMGKTVRDGWGVFVADEQKINLPANVIFDELVLDAALRFDNAHTYKDSTSWQDTTTSHSAEAWSPKIGLALAGKTGQFDYVARAGYGKSFRLPAINSLFWKGDTRSGGNPGLHPEKAGHREAGAEINGLIDKVTLSGGITFFRSDITDLITWVQGFGGVWRPENLEKAQISGHEEFFEIGLYDRFISFIYRNTVTDALNKVEGHNDFDKQLVFSPHYITSLTVRLEYNGLDASYSVRLVDKTYILKANTKYYDSYRLDDVRLGIAKSINGHWVVGLDLSVYNLRDEDYVLLTHYPMPGREWNVGLKISYGDLKKD
ncbi:MAG: TonB-dependent receptor plug domain-containing protein [candidate division Zixibacteria bacterium]|nr:TonB-dependent receptor plug domain-containing protein [candidate division Zixibacteria bacterium]